jgi:carbon-monoxide dehydrogenase small subunit
MVGRLLDETPDPNDHQIKHYLSGNLCRFATYPQVIEPVKLAARKRKTGTPA